MRYRLRTLLIVLAVGPMVLAVLISVVAMAYIQIRRNWFPEATPIRQEVPTVHPPEDAFNPPSNVPY
jgi:Na+/serine symporter